MIKKIMTFAFVATMVVATVAFAGEKGADAEKGSISQFEGTLVCMGCDLKNSEGANADCKQFGHRHALKTSDGKYINFLENKFGADLIKGEKYHNKAMKVSGVFFANANQLDVDSFEVDGKKKSWCGGCSAMDGCAAHKGM